MVSEPSKYMLWIVGLYQSIVPLLLHVFQCCLYLKDITTGNIVYCCRFARGERSMDYRYYINKNLHGSL